MLLCFMTFQETSVFSFCPQSSRQAEGRSKCCDASIIKFLFLTFKILKMISIFDLSFAAIPDLNKQAEDIEFFPEEYVR